MTTERGERRAEIHCGKYALVWAKFPRLPPSQLYGKMDGGLEDDVG